MRLLGVVWCPVSGQVVINQVKSWQHFCKESIYDQFVPRDAEAPVKENIYYCFCNPLEFTQALARFSIITLLQFTLWACHSSA